jgi:outer membrane protein OmpA-like peptidoglycan-associated protein
MTDAGIPDEHLNVNFYGEKVPLIPTSDGVAEPRNRCVEVVMR